MCKNLIPKFKTIHNLSNAQISEIVCVASSTIRKYLAHKDSNMLRAVDPSVNAILMYIDLKKLDIATPEVRKFVKYTPEKFKVARGERSVANLANIIDHDRTTIHRWENGTYQPSAQASKMLFLMNTFGWVE